MAKRMKPFIFTILLFCLSVALLSGCGNDQSVQDLYPLESVSKHGSEESMIYRAKNETVQSVARKISEEKKPEQESKEDNDKMFLVYSDCLYQLEKDQKNPSDTLIEASNKAFVEKNYGEEFLKGYLLASLLDQFFSLSNGQGHYRGYNEREAYPADQTYRTPTKKERKVTPPFVKEGLGKVIKRGEQAAASGQHSRQKTSQSRATGKIYKSHSSYNGYHRIKPKTSPSFSPTSHSPPRVKSGGYGRIYKRH